MTPEQERRPRQPGAVALDTKFVRLRMKLLPPVPDPYEGQRRGRPDRSPSPPPPDDADRPEAGPPAGGNG